MRDERSEPESPLALISTLNSPLASPSPSGSPLSFLLSRPPPMLLPGLTPSPARVIQLPRSGGEPITLSMQPLSLGFHRRLRGRGVVPPQSPRKVARDSAGKPLRDESGLAVMTSDDRDPDYLNQLDLYHQRVAVLAIVESLRSDSHVSFETQPPASSDAEAWTRYADALFNEMEVAGLTAGDLALLSNWTCRLSNLIEGDMQRASANFSSAGPPGST